MAIDLPTSQSMARPISVLSTDSRAALCFGSLELRRDANTAGAAQRKATAPPWRNK